MNFSPDNIYHVYNQGNNKQRIFYNRKDYFLFLVLYKKLVGGVINTIAWCLMPNHFHFMVHSNQKSNEKIKQGGLYIDVVTNGFRKLLSGYARIFNNLNGRSGSLFRQKTKSKCLTDLPVGINNILSVNEYYKNCFHYIHQNPVRAGLVHLPEEWEFSSYREYAGLSPAELCQKELASVYCGYEPGSFNMNSRELIDEKIIKLLK